MAQIIYIMETTFIDLWFVSSFEQGVDAECFGIR